MDTECIVNFVGGWKTASPPIRLVLLPSEGVQTRSRFLQRIPLGLLPAHSDTLAVRSCLDSDGLFVDKAGLRSALLVCQIERVAREIFSAAAGFALDEEGILISWKVVKFVRLCSIFSTGTKPCGQALSYWLSPRLDLTIFVTGRPL